MDIVERLKIDIELLSVSPDENERLISKTLELALSEIETLRSRLKQHTMDYVDNYWKEEDLNRKNKYSHFQKVKHPPINKL